MNINLHLIAFMSGFMIFGLAFFLWIGLDLRDMRKNGRTQMRNKHSYHILLGLWPFLTTLLLVLLYGKVSPILSATYFLLSGLLYLLVGLWDSWYECIGLEPQRFMERPTALSRVAQGYPILAIELGILGTSFWLVWLMSQVFAFSHDQDLLGVFVLLFLIIGSNLLMLRFIGTCLRKATQRRRELFRRS
jgi:hypothetical protein